MLLFGAQDHTDITGPESCCGSTMANNEKRKKKQPGGRGGLRKAHDGREKRDNCSATFENHASSILAADLGNDIAFEQRWGFEGVQT